MTTSSPSDTRLSNSPKRVFASNAVTFAIAILHRIRPVIDQFSRERGMNLTIYRALRPTMAFSVAIHSTRHVDDGHGIRCGRSASPHPRAGDCVGVQRREVKTTSDDEATDIKAKPVDTTVAQTEGDPARQAQRTAYNGRAGERV